MRTLSILGLAFSLACTAGGGPDADPGAKDEIRTGSFDDGIDYCAEYDWYGDGECDGFCIEPDPDCHVQSLDDSGPTLCAAIRGNGQRIPAHFGALARILETYGLVDGAAGGSSGSITTFFLESVQSNPLVQCEDCTPEEQGLRAALLFKSLEGYFSVLARTDEAVAIQGVVALAGSLSEAGVPGLLESDPLAGVAQMRTLLESEGLREFVEPELIELLRSSPDPVFHARDVMQALQGIASFEASDPTIFLRPGLIRFDTLADRMGRIGTFYAGWAPTDTAAMEQFFVECAERAEGRSWAAISGLEMSEGGTCGGAFDAMLTDFRATWAEGDYPSRADEVIGTHMHALAMTSVLEGESVGVWHQARADYQAAREVRFDVDFEDVRFGYFGAESDLDWLDTNPRGYADLKTEKRRMLGARTWREIMSLSPAEPGLTRALEMGTSPEFGEQISFGGWSDLQPTLVLKNLGCDRVVYITRQGSHRGFATNVAGLLGMSEPEDAAIFGTEGEDEGIRLSLVEADAVWCTNWEGPPVTDVAGTVADAYNAPVESSDFFFDGLEQVSSYIGIDGCSR